MKKIMNNKIFKTLCPVFAFLLCQNAALASSCEEEGTISVTGSASVTATPDVASLSFVSTVFSKDARSARSDVEKKAFILIESALKLGLKKDQIISGSLSLYPVYNYEDNKRVFTGYNANREITFKVSDFTLIEKLTDLALKAGIDQIGGFTYELKDSSELKKLADAKAITDAKEKALRLAQGFNVKVKGVCRISFSDSQIEHAPRFMAVNSAKQSMVAEYAPSPVNVSSEVNVVYTID
ncbi:MAG: SIMPL domain-containing protein [Succinivibrio sp.]|nr:SIMPL domain-containing protein [Succinivibrio sp.]